MGPELFNTLTNALEEWTLIKFADDTSLGTAARMFRTALQRDHDRLGEWSNGALMKFIRAKTKSCTCKEATACNDTAWGLLGWSSSLEEATELGQQLHGLHEQGEAREGFILSPSAQHPSDHTQSTAGLWAPQHNRETSPGESKQAGRDCLVKRGCTGQGLPTWRRHKT